MKKEKILEIIHKEIKKIDSFEENEQIEIINEIKKMIHQHSPFKAEPVDCVIWVPFEKVQANDYNPNYVAPPEMELLSHSIESDGYTQPIVSWPNNTHYEVVDGFHRNRVGKENKKISKRIKNYLPLTVINPDREGKNNRIAATIRHNRARGKHSIDGMAEIIVELKRRNWSNKKISKELGMDSDEILRLSQITGLAEMFSNKEFSEAWEADLNIINENDNLEILEENE